MLSRVAVQEKHTPPVLVEKDGEQEEDALQPVHGQLKEKPVDHRDDTADGSLQTVTERGERGGRSEGKEEEEEGGGGREKEEEQEADVEEF